MTLSELLNNSFINLKDKVAISFPERCENITYGELQDKSKQCACSLIKLGMEKQHKFAIIAPSSPEWIELYLGAAQVGIIPVCLNNNSKAKELTFMLNYSDAELIFTTYEIFTDSIDLSILPSVRKVILLDNKKDVETDKVINFSTFLSKYDKTDELDFLRMKQEVKDTDVMVIQFTSGTTGNPKAVQQIQGRVVGNVIALQEELFKYDSDDVILSALPLYHIMGCFVNVTVGLYAGCKIVLVSRFKTHKVLQILQDEKCTVFHGVPTMYNFMLQSVKEYDLSSLKYGLTGGDSYTADFIDEVMKTMDLEGMMTGYGQTEGLTYVVNGKGTSLDKIKSAVGKPLKDVNIKIIDDNGNELPQGKVGEIIVNSPQQMISYYKNPTATEQTIRNGWLYTGDLGCLDEDGYLIFKGRKKDIIVRGGENISPSEIEESLKDYKRVKNVSVVGVPDSVMGEEIAAFIIIDENSKDLTQDVLEGKIRRYMLKNLAKHKCPKYIKFVDSFPLTGSGKIQKFKLVEQLTDRTSI